MSEASLFDSNLVQKVCYKGLDLVCSIQGHRKALIYFHGFPGPAITPPPGGKRIIDWLYPDFCRDFDFYYPLYTLSKGTFSFPNALNHAELAMEFLRSSPTMYDSVTVMGQSMGAQLAAHIAPSEPEAKFILITPFLRLPSDESLMKLVKSFHVLYPTFVTAELVDVYFRQLKTLGEEINLEAAFKKFSRIDILAAQNDEIVALQTIRELAASLPNSHLKILTDQTHAVADRELLRIALQEILICTQDCWTS